MNCLTVEDLAGANDEGLRRMGMGAIDLRNKAKTWLSSMSDHGGVTVKMAALEQENAVLKASVDTLQKQVDALIAAVKNDAPQITQYYEPEKNEISASDLLDDEPKQPAPKRAKQVKTEESVI